MASVQKRPSVLFEQPEPISILSKNSEFDERREQGVDGPRACPKLLGYFLG
jgi:hypothetical protein